MRVHLLSFLELTSVEVCSPWIAKKYFLGFKMGFVIPDMNAVPFHVWV